MSSEEGSERRAPTVSLTGITQGFTQGGQEFTVLDDVSMSLSPGEMVAVLGPSGSGKSTLLNILGLLSSPREGLYLLAGQETEDLSARERSALRLEQVAFVFQSFQLIDHKDVFANVELPLRGLGLPRPERRQRVEQMLERLGLTHRAHAPVQALSGGEKQRVAIARALVTRPKLLLCDEPTGSLDEQRSQDVIALLRELTGPRQTTVIVTHDPWVAGQCDRSLTLRRGRLEPAGEPGADGAEAGEPEAGAGGEPGVVVPQAPDAAGPARRSLPWFRLSGAEAGEAVLRRFRRNLFTMLGVMLGVASLVLTVGLTATISAQISEAFDVYKARHLTVQRTVQTPLAPDRVRELAEGAGMQRVRGLNGVEAAALIQSTSSGFLTVSAAEERRLDFDGRVQRAVLASTPEVLEAQGLTLTQGRMFDEGHVQRGDRVAVVGESTLEELGLKFARG